MQLLNCLKCTFLTLLTCCAHVAHAEEPKPTDLAPLSSIKLDPKAIGDDYEPERGLVIDDFARIEKLLRAQRATAEKLKEELAPIGVVGTAEYSLVRTTKFPLNTVVVRVYIFETAEKRKAWCAKKYGYEGWEEHYKIVETDQEGVTILDSTETNKRIIHFGRVWITTHQLQKGGEHLKAAETVIEQLSIVSENEDNAPQSDQFGLKLGSDWARLLDEPPPAGSPWKCFLFTNKQTGDLISIAARPIGPQEPRDLENWQDSAAEVFTTGYPYWNSSAPGKSTPHWLSTKVVQVEIPGSKEKPDNANHSLVYVLVEEVPEAQNRMAHGRVLIADDVAIVIQHTSKYPITNEVLEGVIESLDLQRIVEIVSTKIK